MSTWEIYLETTKSLMKESIEFKNGKITKDNFNKSMIINVAYLLDIINNSSRGEIPVIEEENEDLNEGQPNEQLNLLVGKNETKDIIEHNKNNYLHDVYLPLSQLSYSIESQINENNNLKTNVRNYNHLSNGTTSNGKGSLEESPFCEMTFEEAPIVEDEYAKLKRKNDKSGKKKTIILDKNEPEKKEENAKDNAPEDNKGNIEQNKIEESEHKDEKKEGNEINKNDIGEQKEENENENNLNQKIEIDQEKDISQEIKEQLNIPLEQEKENKKKENKQEDEKEIVPQINSEDKMDQENKEPVQKNNENKKVQEIEEPNQEDNEMKREQVIGEPGQEDPKDYLNEKEEQKESAPIINPEDKKVEPIEDRLCLLNNNNNDNDVNSIQEKVEIKKEEPVSKDHGDFLNIFNLGENDSQIFTLFNSSTNAEILKQQNIRALEGEDVEEIENDLYVYLPEKKVEGSQFDDSEDLNISSIQKYRRDFPLNTSHTNYDELSTGISKYSYSRMSIRNRKQSINSICVEFEPFLSKKLINYYLEEMNDNYLRYMLFHYQRIKRLSVDIFICEEKMFLNLIKVFILEMGISDRKIYEDTLRNLVYKKNNYDFENFLSCFMKILKLKDDNCIIKYKFLLYVTRMGEEKELNKQHLKKYFELIKLKRVYDEELCEDITNNLINRYMSIYPGEKYVMFPLERIMLVLETFFDNK